MKSIMKLKALMLSAMLVLSLNGCAEKRMSNDDFISRISFALDTEISFKLYGTTDESLIDECINICNTSEKIFSRTKEESEIYKLNEEGSQSVSRETLELLEKGLMYSSLSDGKFDITIEPVSSLWDFSSGEGKVPDADSIKEALAFIDYKKVGIKDQTVSLDEGMGIDLGAIAKGYIADQIKEYLLSQGIEKAMINLGGNVLCVGSKPDGTDFRVGIRDPFETGNLAAAIAVSDKSVVTSGTYERFIEENGVRYHHILDPKTGYSYNNNLESVTIVSDYSVDGDGLSTTCFALGLTDALKLINSMDDVYAMFIDSNGKIVYSDGFEKEFDVTLY